MSRVEKFWKEKLSNDLESDVFETDSPTLLQTIQRVFDSLQT